MHAISSTVGSGVLVANAVTSLAFPPVTSGDVSAWTTVGKNPPEFDLEIWAVSANAVSAALLYAAVGHPLVYADNALTSVDHTAETLTKVAHGLVTGDGPIQLTTSDTLPAGLATATNYWVIKSTDDVIKLAASRADSLAATPVVVTFTSNGTGTHTIVDTASTERVFWHLVKNLGVLSDGAITLTAQQAYTVRVLNYPRAFAYAVSATFGSAVATTIRLFPVVDR
jgi:hypothetical protein